MAAPFNVDVRLTDADDPSRTQFINMTIDDVPDDAADLGGQWRGAPVLLSASNGDFDWSSMGAFVFAGPSDNANVVLIMPGFSDDAGGLPASGVTGTGSIPGPSGSGASSSVIWEVL